MIYIFSLLTIINRSRIADSPSTVVRTTWWRLATHLAIHSGRSRRVHGIQLQLDPNATMGTRRVKPWVKPMANDASSQRGEHLVKDNDG